jgi:lauroyl/myristoyl acyltransferase
VSPTQASTTAAGSPTGIVSVARRFDRGDLVYLAYLLLPLRIFLQLGRPLGWLEMLVRRRAKRAVRENFESAFGSTKTRRELDRLTRQVFEFHQMRTLMLLVAPLMAARGQLERFFPVHNVRFLDEALKMGRGVMLLGAHINSVGGLLAVMQLRRMGYDVRCPMPDPNDAWAPTPFRRLVHRLLGATPVFESIGAFYAQFNVRQIVKVINDGGIVLMMGDGWHSVSFVDADFFGRALPFTNGPMNLARVARCPVVPLFSVGQPHHLHFELEPPFTVDAAPAQEDVARKVRYYVSRVEARALADLPSWQHWMEEEVFDTMQRWRDKTLAERYAT